ncbi:MAG: hypothetical protein ACI8QH_001501 [Flammeovirgaceae bacterium]|jgi:hypothetical protein
MRFLVVVFISLFVLNSCNTEPSVDAKGVTIDEVFYPTMVLDGKDRWKANAATIEGVAKLKKQLAEFNPESQSYEVLQSNLRDEFALIFKNCTMKGDAHDMLHNYLLPFMELFGNLTVGDEDQKEKTLSAIKKHLERFDDYFESEV